MITSAYSQATGQAAADVLTKTPSPTVVYDYDGRSPAGDVYVPTSGLAVMPINPSGYPFKLTDSGYILADPYSDDPLSIVGYRWKDGRNEMLRGPGLESGDVVTDINNSGTVVGSVIRYFNNIKYEPYRQAVSWASGSTTFAEIPYTGPTFQPYYDGADFRSNAVSINNAGMVLGSMVFTLNGATINFGMDGYSWQSPIGGASKLGTFNVNGFATSGEQITPFEVNDSGTIIGGKNLRTGGSYFAGSTPLDFKPEHINGAGHVVGKPADFNTSGVIWWDGTDHVLNSSNGSAVGIDASDNILSNQSDGPTFWRRLTGSGTSSPSHQAELINEGVPYNTYVDGVESMNSSGVMLGSAFNPVGGYGPVLLLPAQLRVDFNRDGKIDTSDDPSNPDRAFAVQFRPYYFWINDNNDSGDTGGDDIPGKSYSSPLSQPPNYDTDPISRLGTVDGVRDLIDFFPVYLDVQKLLAYLKPENGHIYRLVQEDSAVNIVYTDLTPGTAGNYLTDATTAQSLSSETTHQVTSDGLVLTIEFLNKIRNEGKGVLLVEGRTKTRKPLSLQVVNTVGAIEAYVELPLSIDNVEQMFRHLNLSQYGGATPEVASRSVAPNWPDSFSNGKNFVFVHGYNVNQQEARGWASAMFRRMWWTGSKAKFYSLTWFGSDSKQNIGGGFFTPNYHINVEHAFSAAPKFAQFINNLSGPATVAAHSLGNVVVSSAISDYGAAVAQYLLVDAAVAVEAYDGSLEGSAQEPRMVHSDWQAIGNPNDKYPEALWASEWYKQFPQGDARSTLTWRSRFSNRGNTNYYNFYSTGEEVLNYDAGFTSDVLGTSVQQAWQALVGTTGEYTWALQEKEKGRAVTGLVLGSSYGGWGFNPLYEVKTYAVGLDDSIIPVLTPLSKAQALSLTSTLSSTQLQQNPFFLPGKNLIIGGENLGLLYSPLGSDFAKNHQPKLLADMFPARTIAAGRDFFKKAFGDQDVSTFDMMSLETGWPAARLDDINARNRWFHSDSRTVAYSYTRKLFQRWTTIGALDQ